MDTTQPKITPTLNGKKHKMRLIPLPVRQCVCYHMRFCSKQVEQFLQINVGTNPVVLVKCKLNLWKEDNL